ncbi:MAG: calcium-binding protein, partial [Paracoccaceae bacterium]
MPNIDVQLYAAFDTRNFFAPSTSGIAAITGMDTSVEVLLQNGLIIVYTGTGLQFSGTQPTAGTVTGVQVLRADRAKLAEMDLTPAPWQFAEITGTGPLQSYLANAHQQVYDYPSLISVAGNAYFLGGNQADRLTTFFGVDTLLGGAGDDVIFAGPVAYPQRVAPLGLTLDGGAGFDLLEVGAGIGADMRNATLLNFEALTVYQGPLRLSADQFGKGLISLTSTLLCGDKTQPLIIDQTTGKTLDLSRFDIPGSFSQVLFSVGMVINGTAGNDVQYGHQRSDDRFYGLDGNDRVYGGGGVDSLFGGAGDDVLDTTGDPASAVPSFFSAIDELFGGAGNDRLTAGTGAANLFGEAGNDAMFGGSAFASLSGGDGNDYIKGGTALFSGFGGTSQSSRLLGGNGNDTLVTGAVGAFLAGEAGDDRYVINHSIGAIEERAGGGTDRLVTSVSVTLRANDDIERITVSSTTGVTITASDTANII